MIFGALFSREDIASGSKKRDYGRYRRHVVHGKVGIGETIRIESYPFTYVGLLEKKGANAKVKTTWS